MLKRQCAKLNICIIMGFLLWTSHAGGDVTRAGTRTSAGGYVQGAGKKALQESLDNQIADLNKDANRNGPNKLPKQPKDPKNDETKKLQKDIKAFLIIT